MLETMTQLYPTPARNVAALIDNLINDFEKAEFTNHKHDRGGATKYGVTLDTLKWYKNDLTLTLDDVRNMERTEAETLYERKYLRPLIHCFDSELDPQPFELFRLMFDASVHHGLPRSVMFLQEALNICTSRKLKVDGVWGINTQKTIDYFLCTDEFEGFETHNLHATKCLVNTYIEIRTIFMLNIAQNDPDQIKWIEGWYRRAASFRLV